MDVQNFNCQVGGAKDNDIGKTNEDEFAGAELPSDAASSGEFSKGKNLGVDAVTVACA